MFSWVEIWWCIAFILGKPFSEPLCRVSTLICKFHFSTHLFRSLVSASISQYTLWTLYTVIWTHKLCYLHCPKTTPCIGLQARMVNIFIHGRAIAHCWGHRGGRRNIFLLIFDLLLASDFSQDTKPPMLRKDPMLVDSAFLLEADTCRQIATDFVTPRFICSHRCVGITHDLTCDSGCMQTSLTVL